MSRKIEWRDDVLGVFEGYIYNDDADEIYCKVMEALKKYKKNQNTENKE